MEISGTAKKMIYVIGISALVIIGAGILYYRSAAAFPFALGVALTSGLNALKLILLERAVYNVVDMDAKRAERYILAQHMLRFALTAFVLVASALVPFVSIWGAAAGIFTFPLAAYSTKIFLESD